MGSALKFSKQADVGRQTGELARLRVTAGPDAGWTYVLTSSQVTIGRGDENDIQISDLKASRRHAEFIFINGTWNIRDLGSANGVMHNGRATRATPIRTGDQVGMGETLMEFLAADAATMMLQAPPRDPAQVMAANSAFDQQRQKVLALGGGKLPSIPGMAPPLMPQAPRPSGGSSLLQNKRVLIYGGAALLLAIFALVPAGPPKKKSAKKNEETRDLASYLPGNATAPGPASRAAEMFFKSGFREYNNGNYLRARSQFETVLQMQPDHALARLYASNCNVKIENLVKEHLKRGRKAFTAGKNKEARGHYEAVQRLLFRDQANPNFVEARDQLAEVNKAMRGGVE